MELTNAIRERKSIRGFTKKPVSRETLQEVLTLATRAVSAVNAQPWEFYVVTGKVLNAIRADNVECLHNKVPIEMAYSNIDGIYHTRRTDIGKRLLTAMGIAREDRERRDWWLERGFRFFGAPVAIILCMDTALDETSYRLDMGCVTQNICLSAMEFGLGTCVEYQAVAYEQGLRKYLNIPKNKRLVCGIAIGYPDPDFPANHVVSPRENIENITTWCGFSG